jgi:hypothetical protein
MIDWAVGAVSCPIRPAVRNKTIRVKSKDLVLIDSIFETVKIMIFRLPLSGISHR